LGCIPKNSGKVRKEEQQETIQGKVKIATRAAE